MNNNNSSNIINLSNSNKNFCLEMYQKHKAIIDEKLSTSACSDELQSKVKQCLVEGYLPIMKAHRSNKSFASYKVSYANFKDFPVRIDPIVPERIANAVQAVFEKNQFKCDAGRHEDTWHFHISLSWDKTNPHINFKPFETVISSFSANAFFTHLWNDALTKKFTDITFKVGDVKFSAHRNILCVNNIYFSTLCNSQFKEALSSETHVEGDPQSFEMILKSIYHQPLNLDLLSDEQQLISILLKAHEYGESNLVEQVGFRLQELLEKPESGNLFLTLLDVSELIKNEKFTKLCQWYIQFRPTFANELNFSRLTIEELMHYHELANNFEIHTLKSACLEAIKGKVDGGKVDGDKLEIILDLLKKSNIKN